MRVTRDNYQSATLEEWQSAYSSLYDQTDQTLRLQDMMLQLVVDSTRLSESIRKGYFEEALSCLPRVFSWLCSINSKCSSDPQSFRDLSPTGRLLPEVIWQKYPGLCGLCAEKRCICPTWNTDSLSPKERQEIAEQRKGELDRARENGPRPRSLDQWVSMFHDVYGTVNATRTSETKVLHYWEEVGELEVELRLADRVRNGLATPRDGSNDDVTHWEAELADVFSWLSSVYLHIDGHIGNANRLINEFNGRGIGEPGVDSNAAPSVAQLQTFPLSQWIWREFGNTDGDGEGLRCHRCRSTTCSCNLSYERR